MTRRGLDYRQIGKALGASRMQDVRTGETFELPSATDRLGGAIDTAGIEVAIRTVEELRLKMLRLPEMDVPFPGNHKRYCQALKVITTYVVNELAP